MKRSAALIALAISVNSLTLSQVSAAERPTSVPSCEKPAAKAHTPAKVKQPTKVAKKLPKVMKINTNCGEITIALNKSAPQTITNMSALARAKYFDGTYCHRLTTAGLFVLQCGDPSGQGNGNPGSWIGYKNENLPKAGKNNYPAGTVAMANSGLDAAGNATNGGQFFLVYRDTTLGPDYTIWGKVKKGLPLLRRLEKVGAYTVDQNSGNAYYADDGAPVQPVEIKSVTVR
jgi:peptidyl-prolyl cis-trans isomerase B (cyclophilin B)